MNRRQQLWIFASAAALVLIVALAAIGQTTTVKPVIVRNIDNGDRMEIVNTAAMPVFLNPGDEIEEACFPDGPAGKRLVVTRISARMIVPAGQSPHAVIHSTFAGSQYMIAAAQGRVNATEDLYVAAENFHWVLPPSGHLCFQMDRYPAANSARGAFTYTGYYVEYP